MYRNESQWERAARLQRREYLFDCIKIVLGSLVCTALWLALLIGALLISGCGINEKEPDYFTTQGLGVYDKHGFSTPERVSQLVVCFHVIIPEHAHKSLKGRSVAYLSDEDWPEARANKIGGVAHDEGGAYILWNGNHDADATAHELLHMVDWSGPCGVKDKTHSCPEFQRLGVVKGTPNQVNQCYKYAEEARGI